MMRLGILLCSCIYLIRKVLAPIQREPETLREIERKKIAAINENLARELLELFTLTPAAGYTQDDVNGAAYVLTGWGQVWDDDVKRRLL
jgi:uncharacterized protein (DUF1800 family)